MCGDGQPPFRKTRLQSIREFRGQTSLAYRFQRGSKSEQAEKFPFPFSSLAKKTRTRPESFFLPFGRSQWFNELGYNFFSGRIYRYFVDIYTYCHDNSQRISKIKIFQLHIDRMKNCYHFRVVLLEGTFHIKQDTRLFITSCTRTCYFYHTFSYVSCVGMSAQRKKRCWKSVLVLSKLSTPTYL